MGIKPMLAAPVEDLKAIQYPVIATPKLDGIRAIKIAGKILSRKLKPIPNDHIREYLEEALPDGADGEILSGDTFQTCSSAVMSHDGEPDFIYWIFDCLDANNPGEAYEDRIRAVAKHAKWIKSPHVKAVPTTTLYNERQLLEYEEKCLAEGFEGICIRTPKSPYKYGRSTLREGYLLKLKRFQDSEAVILGFEELMHNENALERDNLGHAKRSSAKAGKVPAGTLGKFKVRDIKSKIEFEIGTGRGLSQELRKAIWDNRKKYLGDIVKYKSQPTGVKEAPRFPVWIGFRDKRDM